MIKLCRVSSEASKQSQMLNSDQSTVNRIRSSTSVNNISNQNQVPKVYKCNKYCGETHLPRECPAYNHCCSECGKTGHYETKCFRKKKNVNAIVEKKKQPLVEENFVVDMIHDNNIDDYWEHFTLVNNERNVTFKVDTGSDVNIISV